MHTGHFLPRRQEAASSLVLVVFVVVLLGILIGLAYDYTSTTAIATRRGQDLTGAQAFANGALETAYKRWSVYMQTRQAAPFSNYTNDADFDGFTASLLSSMNTAASGTGYQIKELTIRAVTRADVPTPGKVQDKSNASIGPLANTPGWVASNYSYRARAVVAKTADTSINVSVSRYFQHSDASLFQAMLFFQDDLELHPGPAMTLYGLVHTNSNMYLAAGSGGSLTFTSNVSYHGNAATQKYNAANVDYVRTPAGYVEGTTSRLYDQESGNWTKGTYKDPVYYDTTAAANVSRDARLSNVDALNPLGINVAKAIADNPGNPNATDLHEIIERPAPAASPAVAYSPDPDSAYVDPDAFAAHRLYNTAGLRVFIDHSKQYQTTASDGTKVKSNIHVYAPVSPGSAYSAEIAPSNKSGKNPQPDNIVDYINKAVAVGSSTSGTFKDMREGRDITTNTVDMSVLTPALNSYASTHSDYTGVVYITDITNADSAGNTGNSDAIRLKKGGTLPDMGLTVVTDGAIYVQGDYNTGTTYGLDLPNNGVTVASQPIANTGTNATTDPTHYTVGSYVQKPAAVVGDAVMILSNAWTDLNDSLALSNALRPKALATTFNAAIVSGAVITTDSNASGGAHNFPRFLEDWQSKTPFTYHGSMCELYESDHFKGVYGQSDVYSPPNRRWFFDDAFLTTPPPGNLRTTSYSRGRWLRNTSLN